MQSPAPFHVGERRRQLQNCQQLRSAIFCTMHAQTTQWERIILPLSIVEQKVHTANSKN